MGVLNVTPDSFSDGGQLCTVESVIERASELIETKGLDFLMPVMGEDGG